MTRPAESWRINLASLDLNLGHLADAKSHLDKALSSARQLNLKSAVGLTLAWLGDLSIVEDAFDQAQELSASRSRYDPGLVK